MSLRSGAWLHITDTIMVACAGKMGHHLNPNALVGACYRDRKEQKNSQRSKMKEASSKHKEATEF